MPAYGTGVGGFPLYQCASIMIAETVRYLKERTNSGLRRIVFVTYQRRGQGGLHQRTGRHQPLLAP